VASLKLCTDELLLLIAAPRQIASVTYLSQQPLESPLWRQARQYRHNDGSLLSAAGVAPDLVVDMGGGGRDVAQIAPRIGARILLLPYPQSLADLESAIAGLSAALGRKAAGEALIARIAALRRSAPTRSRDAIWVGGGGLSIAADGLGAEWMALAGLRQRDLPRDRVTLEQLATKPPAVLLRSDYRSSQYSFEQQWLAHPLLRQGRNMRTLATDGRPWTCMGPLMIDEILRLRARVAE
jgi:iron complex transport system substrate-binding protein